MAIHGRLFDPSTGSHKKKNRVKDSEATRQTEEEREVRYICTLIKKEYLRDQ